jgi:amidase
MTASLCELSASELVQHIRTRKVSSREVVAAFLNQIDRLNPIFNAVVSRRDPASVLAEADLADAAVQGGETLGPLHGLPIAIKDLALTKGIRTTFGSPIFADFIPEEDGLSVARIRAAGAIIVGKTNTPEFGYGSHTTNRVFGPTRNAYDPSRSAGGSSGGAAVALALRMLPMADGSDYGGSLRNPAAFNNVLGLRPSQGRVPYLPSSDVFYGQMATEGPMARCIPDLRLLLTVQAGPDPRAPLSLWDAIPALATPLADGKGVSIAWLGDLGGHLPVEPGILELCESALDRLSAAGCRVEAMTPTFDFAALWRAFVVIRLFNNAARLSPLFANRDTRAALNAQALWEAEQFTQLSASELSAAALVRSAWHGLLTTIFETYDYLVLPTAQVFPFNIEWAWPTQIAGRTMQSYHQWMEVVAPGTLSGCPVLNVPVGFREGLPMGMQIIARPRADDALLRFGALYEGLHPFADNRPGALSEPSISPSI